MERYFSFIQVGTRDYEFQDTAKSYIGFRNVISFIGRDKAILDNYLTNLQNNHIMALINLIQRSLKTEWPNPMVLEQPL